MTFYEELTIYSPILSELDEDFESWTELDPDWEFENIRLASDAYALEGTGKISRTCQSRFSGNGHDPLI
ncbi:MAG: hypothetical protein U5N56_08590 [Candidatus Marinimicrobia bacterium]|nr:hypothetical protein [Candidatus Neomarinimicrobiota bacterium]